MVDDDGKKDSEENDDGWKVHHGITKGRGRKPGSKVLCPKTPVRFTPALKRRFLKMLAEGYDRTSAAARCGISRATFYHHTTHSPEFRRAVEVATEKGNSHWEEKVIDRINNGSKTVETDAEGNVIKTITKDNDALLLRMLESKKPNEWGKRQTNVNIDQSDGGGAIQKLASLLGVTVEDKPIDITDAEYEEKD